MNWELEDNPDELTLEQTWESCLGYYLFLKKKPNNLNLFAALVSGVLIEFCATAHGLFVVGVRRRRSVNDRLDRDQNGRGRFR